jgi:hypothetical protein
MTTTTDTTLDFGPLLALRTEVAQHLAAGLCERIVDGDPRAIIAGQAFLEREERIERDLNAKLAALYDTSSPAAQDRERRADDGLGWVIDAINATGDLCTAIDDPDQYVAPVSA